jgi:rare lipoprotein A
MMGQSPLVAGLLAASLVCAGAASAKTRIASVYSGATGRQAGITSVYSGVTGRQAGITSVYSGVTGRQGGIASVYSGGRTASGEHVAAAGLTAAHRSLPFGTRVRVTNARNGRSVVVCINDRGPFVRGRVIDVTPAAARALGFSGLARVTLWVLGRASPW